MESEMGPSKTSRSWPERATRSAFSSCEGAPNESWLAPLPGSEELRALVATLWLSDPAIWSMDQNRGTMEIHQRLSAARASRPYSRVEVRSETDGCYGMEVAAGRS